MTTIRRSPAPGARRRVVARLAAATLAVLGFLLPAAAVQAEGPQPDTCTFLAQYPDATESELGENATHCEASFTVPDTQTLVFLEVTQYRDVNSVASARAGVAFFDAPGLQPTSTYGQVGKEGVTETDSHIIVFAWYNYVGWIGTNNVPAAVAAATSAAVTLNSAMQAGIGPPATPAVSPGATGAAGTTAPSGLLEVGVGCGEDGAVLRCTSSVSGTDTPIDALAYAWTIDGTAQVSTTDTLEVDLQAAGIAEGDHAIVVTVTDPPTGKTGTGTLTMHTSAKIFVVTAPSCTSGEDAGTFELRCRSSAVNAPPNADLVYTWTVGGQVVTGVETISRTVGQGIVFVGVSARDQASGRQTAVATAQFVVNPAGIITNLLTGGQTSDPQYVVDEITGSALGAAALGAGAAIAGALGAIGGVATGGAGAAGTAGGAGSGAAAGAGPSSAGPPGTGGAAPSAPTPDSVGEAASDLLGAEAGSLPPPSAATLERWKNLVGWPPGPAAEHQFMEAFGEAMEQGLGGDALIAKLRADARAAWAGLGQ